MVDERPPLLVAQTVAVGALPLFHPLRIRPDIVAAVDQVRLEQGQLLAAVHQPFGDLDALHQRVILIAHLVGPGTEASARVEVARFERG